MSPHKGTSYPKPATSVAGHVPVPKIGKERVCRNDVPIISGPLNVTKPPVAGTMGKVVCPYEEGYIMSEDVRQQIRQQLAQAGLRATPQRLIVLEILQEADEHLDAEAIYERARERDSRISLATVYRTLAKLKEVGLVDQRYFARDHKREYYEATGKGEHYHFTCLGCGKVIEVETPRIAQARRELSEALGLEFVHACICFEGFCPECAARRREKGLSPHRTVEVKITPDARPVPAEEG